MSTTTTRFLRYNQRWQSLCAEIDRTKTYYAAMSSSDLPRQDTIVALLGGLRLFGEGQFTFFKRFQTPGALVDSVRFSPDHALAWTLTQIGNDLGVIQRIAQQRLLAQAAATRRIQSNSPSQPDPTELAALNRADKLAWFALEPAITSGLIAPYNYSGYLTNPTDNMDVITYFNKVPHIRVMPYANIAVVGIPYTCTQVGLDHLAIPHEVGHFVYWQKETPGDIKELLADRVSAEYLRCWEEIRADGYGCLVAGPVIGYSFQEMALQNSSARFVKVDDHPAPYLRPRILVKFLHELGKQAGDIVQQDQATYLDARWKDLKECGDVETRKNLDDAIGLGLDLQEDRPLDFMIKQAVEIMVNRTGAPKTIVSTRSSWPSAGLMWTPKTSDINQFGDLFSIAHIDILSHSVAMQSTTPKQNLAMSQPGEWKMWVNTKLKIDPDGPPPISIDGWTRILQAEGWTDGGPQTDPAH